MKSNFGPAVARLESDGFGRDRRFGHLPYRLLIGPLSDAAAAARLCAHFVTPRRLPSGTL